MSRRRTAVVEPDRHPAERPDDPTGPSGRRPAHHGPDGRFRNPWRMDSESPSGLGDVLKWMWEHVRSGLPSVPPPEALPRADPRLAEPRAAPDARELRVTWIGHATFLVQAPGVTVLTDPMFGRRASPVRWAGPARFSPPGVALEALPAVDAVLLSHDHYDHLDAGTVDRLHARYGEDLVWFTPLGYSPWFERRGVTRVVELDWWGTADLETPRGHLRIRALPARHWSRRHFRDTGTRLWSSWSLSSGDRRLYFCGDSGYCPGFAEIGEWEDPFDVALMPIGAYEPRWFMKSSHMNPEEAAQACRDVQADHMVGMHWGTFRLTDEPPLEPPVRARRAWSALGLPPERLHIPALGETLCF